MSVVATLPALPAELAPSLRAAAEQLIAECGEAEPRIGAGGPSDATDRLGHRCHFCRERGGKFGGHHLPSGTVVWVHHRCHRKHHAAENAAERAIKRG